PTPAPYTLSLHDALPISSRCPGCGPYLEYKRRDGQTRRMEFRPSVAPSYAQPGIEGVADGIAQEVQAEDHCEERRARAEHDPGRSEEHTSELQSLRHLVC